MFVATFVTVVTNMMAWHGIVNGVRNEYDGVRSESEDGMKTDDPWVNMAKGILRAEMTRRAITYDQLAERLAEMGSKDTAVNLRNKVARGGFSAAFFLQCLRAVGASKIDVSED